MSHPLLDWLELARRWQRRAPFGPQRATWQMLEEAQELDAALGAAEGLVDSAAAVEVGDVLVTALRLYLSLLPSERSACWAIAEEKLRRRTGPGGQKDPAAEAEAFEKIWNPRGGKR